ncbi:MAG: hypothetical protein K9K79_13950 [Desulfohalobiaceae bacterium]|nr:hypothetical protein [Desulfohalobiaceae bacterium]
MTTIMPEGKRVKDALTWISAQSKDQQDQIGLVREAVFRFNLTPKEEKYLYHLYQDQTRTKS